MCAIIPNNSILLIHGYLLYHTMFASFFLYRYSLVLCYDTTLSLSLFVFSLSLVNCESSHICIASRLFEKRRNGNNDANWYICIISFLWIFIGRFHWCEPASIGLFCSVKNDSKLRKKICLKVICLYFDNFFYSFSLFFFSFFLIKNTV